MFLILQDLYLFFFLKNCMHQAHGTTLDSSRPHAKPLVLMKAFLNPFPAAKTIIDKDI